MRLTELLDADCIKVPLAAAEKQAAIYELIDLLVDAGRITDRQQVRQAVWQRESTRTTGIGHGLAIPHGKTTSCDHLVMAIGRPAQPIDFQSIDGRPVSLIILLISPADQTGPHIQALATVSRMMMNEQFRHAIRDADSAQAVYQLIEDHEKQAAS
jgi:fructose-specific phosphotransferase system IIA component